MSCRGFRCSFIHDYNTNSAIWDDGVWDADNDVLGQQPLIVFFSAGNDGAGNNSGCGGAADTVGTPGNAKIVITVGANETDRDCSGTAGDNVGDMARFSSRGPVAKGNPAPMDLSAASLRLHS